MSMPLPAPMPVRRVGEVVVSEPTLGMVAFWAVPMAAAAGIGALVGGPEHRVSGAIIGAGAGLGATAVLLYETLKGLQ